MVTYRFLMSLLFLLSVATSTLASPIASIDRSVIAEDDTLTLKIRINKSGRYNSPDLTPLKKDFHVLGNSQSSQHMLRNGQAESWTEWTISLIPKRKGQLTIPPINVDGEHTQPITIQVQPQVPVNTSSLKPIFLESEVDKSTLYVQQQLIYTVRVFQSIQLENMNISEPSFDNAVIEKLGQSTFQRRIQNTPYRVHELRYAIFPQQAGDLIIPELVFTANEAVSRRSMFSLPGQGTPIRKMTQQHTVNVKPPLATFRGKEWLPAESLKIQEDWSGDLDEIRVGDSITRSITLTAQGLLASLLPPTDFSAIKDAKIYPDQGSTETIAGDNSVISTRKDSAAIIPMKEGKLVLPAISFSWWDITTNKIRQATIPARTINVLPALVSKQSQATPLAVDHSQTPTINPVSQPVNNPFWQILSAILATAWLLTLLLWWRSARGLQGTNTAAKNQPSAPSANSEAAAFKQLSNACRSQDLIAVREALIHWGQQFWPQHHIKTLYDIRQLSQNPSLTTATLQLDNKLYGKQQDSSWNSENLLALISLIRKQRSTAQGKEEQLPPLYN